MSSFSVLRFFPRKAVLLSTRTSSCNASLNYHLLCILCILFVTRVEARIVTVSTASTFKSAVTALLPGDTIDVASGTYDLNTYLNVTTVATADQPALIRAKVRGGVILINKSYFDFKSAAYVTLEGFDFSSADGTVIKIESSNHIRVTRNTFHLKESTGTAWIIIQDLYNATSPASNNNRIDHNLFENKALAGNMVRIDGFEGTPTLPSQHDVIDHNHFRNVGPRIDNGMETIRIGVSSLSGKSSYTVVEHNLFEDCDGDPEFISLKTDEDTIRYNTFRSCQGTLCMRQTSKSVAYGNFFLGNGKAGTGGVRIYKSDNKVYSNYFTNLTGTIWDAALTITNGDVDSNNTNQSSHFRPLRPVFAFNTLVDNLHNIEIGFTNGGSYGKPPLNIIIANNIIVGSKNQFVFYYTAPTAPTYLGNMYLVKDSSSLGITATDNQFKAIDPQLVFADSIWRLSAASPARDAAQGEFSYVTMDIDGELRGLVKSVGADEYSVNQPVNKPLGHDDVGPASDLQPTLIRPDAVTGRENESFQLQQNYPNPFNPETVINFRILTSGFVSLKVYTSLGKEIATLVYEQKTAGEYTVRFSGAKLSSGIYYYVLRQGNSTQTKKMTVLK